MFGGVGGNFPGLALGERKLLILSFLKLQRTNSEWRRENDFHGGCLLRHLRTVNQSLVGRWGLKFRACTLFTFPPLSTIIP